MTNKISVTNSVQSVKRREQDPDSVMAIIGLAMLTFFPPIGLVVSIVAMSRSKKRGYDNSMALAGIIINALISVLVVLSIVIMIVVFAKLGDTAQYRFDNRTNHPNDTFVD